MSYLPARSILLQDYFSTKVEWFSDEEERATEVKVLALF